MKTAKKTSFMLGNEAIARGAIEAGIRFVACYPGTPSSEVVEALIARKNSGSPECAGMRIEYSINEKVALESACGASLAGAPALAAMKHVGVNVAADPLFTAAYIGMPGGLVILSADDPGCHSSQNEQDNRHYARAAHLPCLEPIDAEEARQMAKEALDLSRKLAQPVLLRTTTRVNHCRGPVNLEPPRQEEFPPHKPECTRFVPVPAVAKNCRKLLQGKMLRAEEIANASRFNIATAGENGAESFGIIASGVARAYLFDALKENPGPRPSVLELGMTWPLPTRLIRDFVAGCKNVLVLEEGDNLLEREIRAIAGGLPAKITGKNEILTKIGEYSTTKVSKVLAQWLGHKPDEAALAPAPLQLPPRPPNLCPGCAHRSVYYAARRIFGENAIYSNDIGCYTLGMLPPLSAADFMICMGSSISAGSGFAAASSKPVVAFIGDSTFFHSGITGLANAVFNRHDIILVILDNGTTAMTGHQPNPGMLQDALGSGSRRLDMEKIIDGLGVSRRLTVKSHNLKALMDAMSELKNEKGVRVLIAREPCLLFARQKLNRKNRTIAEAYSQCEAGEKCLRELACPAFIRSNGMLAINGELCGGCMLCVQIAPEAFRAKKIPA